MKKKIKSIFEKIPPMVNRYGIIFAKNVCLQQNRPSMKKHLLILFSILVYGVSMAQSNCQEIIQLILSNSTEETIETDPTTGEITVYYDLCPGETLTLESSAEFPENNTNYFQSVATTSFSWHIDEVEESNNLNFSHTFNDAGGYVISLYAEDVNGCVTSAPVEVFVRVSTIPTFSLSVEPSSVCPGVVTNIGPNASSNILFLTDIEAGSWESIPCEDEFSDPLYLPDGDGAVYSTDIVLTCFRDNQILTNVNDIIGVDINMEHSYSGDLDIYLTAPNGVRITLFEQSGANNWFGAATDGDATETNPGIGYDYGWSMNATYNGTMVDAFNNNYTIPNPDGFLVDGGGVGNMLISGIYQPVGDFNDFIGTPLNGTWTITVVDYLAIDNGWIFSWGISINSDIIPSSWSFSNYIVDEYFLPEPSIVSNNDTSIIIEQDPGIHNYTYEIVDNFGCTYSQDIAITSPPYVVAYFIQSQDTLDYNNGMVQFTNFSTPDPQTTLVSNQWSFGDGQFSTEEHPEHDFNQTGSYSVQLTVTDEIGCTDSYLSEVVAAEDYFIWAPNAFSPNGDGLNEIFRPIIRNFILSSFNFYIYDRWGKLVYQSDNYYSGWDGIRMNNGIAADTDSYYSYVVKFNTHHNVLVEYTGVVLIIR